MTVSALHILIVDDSPEDRLMMRWFFLRTYP